MFDCSPIFIPFIPFPSHKQITRMFAESLLIAVRKNSLYLIYQESSTCHHHRRIKNSSLKLFVKEKKNPRSLEGIEGILSQANQRNAGPNWEKVLFSRGLKGDIRSAVEDIISPKNDSVVYKI